MPFRLCVTTVTEKYRLTTDDTYTMITVIKTGDYRLVGTKGKTMLLILDGTQVFSWIDATGFGDILGVSHAQHDRGRIFAIGKYRLYDVQDEQGLTDVEHLELMVGKGTWQGYLLPTGLPDEKEKRKRIIPTEERITCVASSCPVSPHYDSIFSSAIIF